MHYDWGLGLSFLIMPDHGLIYNFDFGFTPDSWFPCFYPGYSF